MLEDTRWISGEDVIRIIQRTLNKIDPRLIDHGKRVAYFVYKMLQVENLYNKKEQQNICFTAILHDIGAYKTEEIDKMVQFETSNAWNHAIYGYLFLKHFSPLSNLAFSILHHHTDWKMLKEIEDIEEESKKIAQLIYIADRADIFFENRENKKEKFFKYLNTIKGVKFNEEVISLFLEADIEFPIEEQIKKDKEFQELLQRAELSNTEIQSYLYMIIFAIDFRSYYTVTHTITTANISKELALLLGLEEKVRQKIIYGAMLHDLGKVGIPIEILESSERLTLEEMNIMKKHVEITEEILGEEVDEEIKQIALAHHEKLDGSGYPKGLLKEELTISQRVVAVADIISALSQKRSYKKEYKKEQTIEIISDMSKQGFVDKEIVELFIENSDVILRKNEESCDRIIQIYEDMYKEYRVLRHLWQK